MRNRSLAETLSWAGTVIGGAWLSMWTARCVVDCMARTTDAVAGRSARDLVEAALEQQPPNDTLMEQAFEEALAEETEEEMADAR